MWGNAEHFPHKSFWLTKTQACYLWKEIWLQIWYNGIFCHIMNLTFGPQIFIILIWSSKSSWLSKSHAWDIKMEFGPETALFIVLGHVGTLAFESKIFRNVQSIYDSEKVHAYAYLWTFRPYSTFVAMSGLLWFWPSGHDILSVNLHVTPLYPWKFGMSVIFSFADWSVSKAHHIT